MAEALNPETRKLLIEIATLALGMGYHHYVHEYGGTLTTGDSPNGLWINAPHVRDIFRILGWPVPESEEEARFTSGRCYFCGEPYFGDPNVPHFHPDCLARVQADEAAREEREAKMGRPRAL